MSRKFITVDFFGVVVGGGNGRFEPFLERLADMPEPDREVTIKHTPVRMTELESGRHTYTGDVVAIRMNRVPSRARQKGPITSFDLDDDEGFGEHNAFLFDPHTQVLAIERHRLGVSATTFAEYVSKATGADVPILVDVCVQAEAMQKLLRSKSVKTIQFRIANASPSALRRSGLSTFGFVSLMSRTRSSTLALKLTVGQERARVLERGSAIELAQGLLRLDNDPEGDVSALEVTGHNDGDQSFELNLLKDRIVEHVSLGDTSRQVPYDVRRTAVEEAFRRRKSELEAMYVRQR